MKLSVKGMACAFGLLWAVTVFLVGLANLQWSGYGRAFLDCVASIYPGYEGTATFGQVIVVTIYGFVDGVIGGLVFAVLYNFCAGRKAAA